MSLCSAPVCSRQSELNNPHRCPHCDRRFAFQLNVQRHCWLHHKHLLAKPGQKCPGKTGESHRKREKLEDIKCWVCSRYFLNWKKLQLHMLDHTQTRPFKCEECGRGFKEESKLRRHSVIHTGEKPWDCSYCGRCFSLKQNKEIHERLHTGDRPHGCGYCGEVFIQKVNLRRHQTKHQRLNHVVTDNAGLRATQARAVAVNKNRNNK